MHTLCTLCTLPIEDRFDGVLWNAQFGCNLFKAQTILFKLLHSLFVDLCRTATLFTALYGFLIALSCFIEIGDSLDIHHIHEWIF